MISKKGRYVASSDQTIVGFDGVICTSRSGLSTLKTPLTPLDAIEQRHSVRQYDERPLEETAACTLQTAIEAVNEEGDLDIQLVRDEPKAFTSLKSRMVGFSGVRNYLALVGHEYKNLDLRVGYHGEKLVVLAQALGLNSCWVGGTYKMPNRGPRVDIGQKLSAVVALGYGKTAGKPHRSKPVEAICPDCAEMPPWFKRGVDAALLAPTALNQQKFSFHLKGTDDDGTPIVQAKTKRGAFTQMDLGIAMCHFEIGTGAHPFQWA